MNECKPLNEGDRAAFLKYVTEMEPDVIALQETWLPAAGGRRCVHAQPRDVNPDAHVWSTPGH